MANRSVFPQQLDTFVQLRDLTPELSQDADELKDLMKIPNKSSEQISRMNELLVELQDYYMSTETWNKLCDCIVNMENFTLQKFTTYYRYRQTYDNSISYDLFNSVRYTDGNIYMLYTTLPSYQAGINPTDTNYWLKLSNKGDKGDKGNQWKGNYDSVTNYLIDDVIAFDGSSYICIQSCNNKQPDINPTYWQLFAKRGYSGVDGKDGVGLVFKGSYSDVTTYITNNCVEYQGSLYSCKQDGVTGFPPTDTTFWTLVVAKGGSVTVSTLRNTVTVSTNTSNIRFFGGEITAFNPSLDSLFVYQNTIYKEKGQDYVINADKMSIDCVGGSWDGTQIPITFNFVVIKNIVQTISFNDGSLIQNGSITVDKLNQDLQNKINNNSFSIINTDYTAIVDGVSNIPIGHSNFNSSEDILTVKYMNEILTKNLNYAINPDNLSIDLLDWTLDKDEVIYFETMKKTINVITELDGSLISEKTISEAKLSQGLQDKITEIDTKANQIDFLNHINDIAPHGTLARQAIINGNFDIWQRGISFSNPTSGKYTADRWNVGKSSGTETFPNITVSKQAITPGDIPNCNNFLRINTDGVGSGYGNISYWQIGQAIERGTSMLCGLNKKVTLSFYAKSSIANKKLGVYCGQSYGSGGSASETLMGTIFTLSSVWTKYKYTFNTNSLVGKTFGVNNDDSLNVTFALLLGSNYSADSIGSPIPDFGGAGNVDIAQVQVCSGDVALPFSSRSVAEELRMCQRYCLSTNNDIPAYNSFGFTGVVMSSTSITATLPTPVSMRIKPSLNLDASKFQINIFNPDTHTTPSNVSVMFKTNENIVFSFTGVSLPLGANVDMRINTSGIMILDAEL